MARYDTYVKNDDRFKEEADSGFIGFNNRLRADQLQAGMLANSENGRLSLNGEWQTRKGISNELAPLSVGDTALTLPFDMLSDAGGGAETVAGTIALSSGSGSNLVITPASQIDKFGSDGNKGTLNISGTSDSDVDKNHIYTRSGSTLVVTGSFTYTGSCTLKIQILNDDVINNVYGSCLFSDPRTSQKEYIILAANTKAVAIDVSNVAVKYDIPYPASGETVGSPVSMIQTFNKVFIFRDGETAFEIDLAENDITNLGSTKFSLVESGSFAAPVQLAPSSISITNGVATATFSSSSAMGAVKVGDEVTIEAVGSPSTFTVGTRVVVHERNDAGPTFKFFIQLPDTGGNVSGVVLSQRVSGGLGFTHMPAPKYGVYHQRRLCVPYKYETTASNNVFTERKNLDEILLSDLLDTNSYDQLYAQFRFNAGGADFNVGMLSFSDDKLIVFNRNSIHLVTNSIPLESSKVELLTNEVGCTARNSIVQVGNNVLFLSDNGVYGLNFQDLYNLRGNEVPLSQPIQALINDIDTNNSDKAVGLYFDNRYFLAIPVGSNQAFNNRLIIYNFLNKSWESIDTVGDENFAYTNLIVAGKGTSRGVYVVNTDGGLHKLDQIESGSDFVITSIGGSVKDQPIRAIATTRMFNLKSIDRKKWNNFELHVQSSADNESNLSIEAIAENPDSINGQGVDTTIDLRDANFYIGQNIPQDEDVSIRGRIGNIRAYGLQFKLTSTLGRPRLRAIKVAGSETYRSTSSVQ